MCVAFFVKKYMIHRSRSNACRISGVFSPDMPDTAEDTGPLPIRGVAYPRVLPQVVLVDPTRISVFLITSSQL
jgi:hypothetical protein